MTLKNRFLSDIIVNLIYFLRRVAIAISRKPIILVTTSMELETFLAHFESLIDTPKGVQKLRQLILQLAVMGKLVPQDPSDEPASVLLEKIKAEKERLVKEGKIKKEKPLGAIKPEEIPYELPSGWEWVRLSEIGHDWGQKKPDVTFTYIDVSAIEEKRGFITDKIHILTSTEAPSRARKIVKKGTVIYSIVRPYLLNIAIVDKNIEPEPIVSTAFALIHPFNGISSKYVYFYLRSQPFINYVASQMVGIAYPAISEKNFYRGLIPLPSLAEQNRIVAKCDRLLVLCDELEAQKTKQQNNLILLGQTATSKLIKAKNQEEFSSNWGMIADNFEAIYSTAENVSQLRKAILQLAVMGRLVPQVPNDEPASVLLEKIKAEKERLVKEGKIKKEKPLGAIKPEEIPYELPSGWEWVRFPEVGELARGKSQHRPRNDLALYENGIYPLVQTGDVARANRIITTYTNL